MASRRSNHGALPQVRRHHEVSTGCVSPRKQLRTVCLHVVLGRWHNGFGRSREPPGLGGRWCVVHQRCLSLRRLSKRSLWFRRSALRHRRECGYRLGRHEAVPSGRGSARPGRHTITEPAMTLSRFSRSAAFGPFTPCLCGCERDLEACDIGRATPAFTGGDPLHSPPRPDSKPTCAWPGVGLSRRFSPSRRPRSPRIRQ